jgi:hypothetical protein
VRPGLLYAGTDIGVYYSTDDGANWQPLQRNLPTAWVRDLLVKRDDLIAATQGRALWVLDNVSPLRQQGGISGNTKAHLFQPATAVRLHKNRNHDTPLPREEPAGRNPPTGAVIDYWLAAPAKRVELEIHDSAGKVARRFASDSPEPAQEVERYFSEDWLKPAASLSNAPGTHRFVWNLRPAPPRTTEYEYSIATAWDTGVDTSPAGPLVAPGTYRVVLRVDGKEFVQPLTVVADPRVPLDPEALAQVQAASSEARRLLALHYDAAAQHEYVKERIEQMRKENAGKPAVIAALDAYESRAKPLAAVGGDLPENLGLDNLGSQLRSIASDVEDSDRAPTEPQRRALKETGQRLDRALAAWAEVRDKDLAALNASLKAAGVETIVIPPVDRIKLSGPSASREMP